LVAAQPLLNWSALYDARAFAGIIVIAWDAMSSEIVFFLNGRREAVSGIAPTLTLMNYLRRNRRLTGTKEGCAEGDCGACTVIIGELEGESVRYRTVNACILFVPMLHGKLVLTVEGVQGPRGELHPVQQAMVDCHGSQCGFCTPGFVMSLYAAYLSEPVKDAQRVDDLLAGNLCRCTGYGPIAQAAKRMHEFGRPEWDAERRAGDRAKLLSIQDVATLSYAHQGSSFLAPASKGELCRLYVENPDAALLSGATDAGLWVTKQHRSLPKLIYTGRVDALKQITTGNGVLRIGAAVTWHEARKVLESRWPSFGELVRRFGSEQVRNSGTVGGNIANGSPIGDGPPALIALGSRVILRRGEAGRVLPLEEFFIAYGKQDRSPGEIVEAVEVPLSASPEELGCYKVSKRFDQDISAVCGCFNLRLKNDYVEDARICFGGMAPTPRRAFAVERHLMGSAWTLGTVEKAAAGFEADYTPIGDMRASSSYRMRIAKNLLLRYFHERANGSGSMQLAGPLLPAFA
jgi:xanthine dehydrogenase small subunit